MTLVLIERFNMFRLKSHLVFVSTSMSESGLIIKVGVSVTMNAMLEFRGAEPTELIAGMRSFS